MLLFENGLTGCLIMGRVICRVGILIVQLRRLRRMGCTQHKLTMFGHRSATITPPNCCQGRWRWGVADWSPGRRDGLPNGQNDNTKRKNEHTRTPLRLGWRYVRSYPAHKWLWSHIKSIICKYPMCVNPNIRWVVNVDLTRLIVNERKPHLRLTNH